MKPGIHPTWYPDAVVTCACGNTWTTGSTKKEIHTDVCNKCHPFFTGEQRIVDTAGQVERFMKRISAKEQISATQPAPEAKKAKREKRRERKTGMTPAELPLAEAQGEAGPEAAPVAQAETSGSPQAAPDDKAMEPIQQPVAEGGPASERRRNRPPRPRPPRPQAKPSEPSAPGASDQPQASAPAEPETKPGE